MLSGGVRRLKELVHEKHSGKLFFVFEFCGGGNLFTLLQRSGGGLPEEQIKSLMCGRPSPTFCPHTRGFEWQFPSFSLTRPCGPGLAPYPLFSTYSDVLGVC